MAAEKYHIVVAKVLKKTETPSGHQWLQEVRFEVEATEVSYDFKDGAFTISGKAEKRER